MILLVRGKIDIESIQVLSLIQYEVKAGYQFIYLRAASLKMK